MSKSVNQEWLLEQVKNNATKVIFTNVEIKVLANAQAAVPNIEEDITAVDFGAIVNGDVSGKKLPFKAKAGLTVVGDNPDNTLNKLQHANFFAGAVHLTTAQLPTAKNVNAGDAFNVNAFDAMEIIDPT